MAKKVTGYLMGRVWYSTDNTDCPNLSEFPSRFTTVKEEAEAWLREESRKDSTWGYGEDRAYIAPIYDDGSIGDRIYN